MVDLASMLLANDIKNLDFLTVNKAIAAAGFNINCFQCIKTFSTLYKSYIALIIKVLQILNNEKWSLSTTEMIGNSYVFKSLN